MPVRAVYVNVHSGMQTPLREDTSAMALVTDDRMEKAVRMRVAGATQTQIARELGISQPSVSEMLKKYMLARRDAMQEDIEVLRAVQHERLEVMFASLFREAGIGRTRVKIGDDGKPVLDGGVVVHEPVPLNLHAIDRMVAVLDRINMLHGLNAPMKVDANVITNECREFGQTVAMVILKYLPEDLRRVALADLRRTMTRNAPEVAGERAAPMTAMTKPPTGG